MWPDKFRRLTLALRYWQYTLSLPNDCYAMNDTVTLAPNGKPISVTRLWQLITIDISCPLSSLDVDNIFDAVEQAYLKDIEAFIIPIPRCAEICRGFLLLQISSCLSLPIKKLSYAC
ncbi:hypothetical protein ARMSODRAFT_561656 [Armillaria solidipes]|uniref:Uncharacterized protein n=1 Tax=Armillaria solidipes TaxID=1076256 RepID=A0A2H3B9R6_9AGAR|nr:hypothetical protein ARMSODRAFT_561656 [Armillaria solidipes]